MTPLNASQTHIKGVLMIDLLFILYFFIVLGTATMIYEYIEKEWDNWIRKQKRKNPSSLNER